MACEKDGLRKPARGMWDLCERLNGGLPLQIAHSFFVGDAAGRPKMGGRKKDHSRDDLGFAEAVGVPFHLADVFFARRSVAELLVAPAAAAAAAATGGRAVGEPAGSAGKGAAAVAGAAGTGSAGQAPSSPPPAPQVHPSASPPKAAIPTAWHKAP